MNDNRQAVLMLFAAALFWSTSGVLIKLVALHPMAIAGWRSLIAGGVIMLLCRREVKISWGINPLLAAACMGLFCICFVVATKLTTAANAIVLQYAASAYVAILAPRMLGEPTRRQDWYLFVAGGRRYLPVFFRLAFHARYPGHPGRHGRIDFLGRRHDFSA
jgi:drug/metabolite transporter (DMT)-like permease